MIERRIIYELYSVINEYDILLDELYEKLSSDEFSDFVAKNELHCYDFNSLVEIFYEIVTRLDVK
jgi:hypothetical protein